MNLAASILQGQLGLFIKKTLRVDLSEKQELKFACVTSPQGVQVLYITDLRGKDPFNHVVTIGSYDACIRVKLVMYYSQFCQKYFVINGWSIGFKCTLLTQKIGRFFSN